MDTRVPFVRQQQGEHTVARVGDVFQYPLGSVGTKKIHFGILNVGSMATDSPAHNKTLFVTSFSDLNPSTSNYSDRISGKVLIELLYVLQSEHGCSIVWKHRWELQRFKTSEDQQMLACGCAIKRFLFFNSPSLFPVRRVQRAIFHDKSSTTCFKYLDRVRGQRLQSHPRSYPHHNHTKSRPNPNQP